MKKTTNHHIWCNFAYSGISADECKQCNSLNSKFPINSETKESDLVDKYFPDAVPRTSPSDES